MRDWITGLLILLILLSEATFWAVNPMRIPPAFLPARAFGLQVFRELDSSMKPTISPRQRILVSAWPYWKHEPQAGDVVAFLYPPNPSLADLKRIVAVGGSSVEIRNGIVYVDGKSDTGSSPGPTVDGDDMAMRRVPPGSYFVLGDDRGASEDSRNYGVIRRSHIIGEAIWPQTKRHSARGY
jgi:signal peptidase I